uniref:Uncharacterized protein n=1 Tax=Rhizophora mucronata TaxID=61149 RepID=A0A2P2NUX9_RHIMU
MTLYLSLPQCHHHMEIYSTEELLVLPFSLHMMVHQVMIIIIILGSYPMLLDPVQLLSGCKLN